MPLPRIAARELFRGGHTRGVLFDMDGVLADTEAFHLEAWQRLASEHDLRAVDGTDLNAVARRTFGQTNDVILPLLWKAAGRPAPEDLGGLSYEKESYYRDAARGRVRPLAGLERFLRWLSEHHLPLAIGTSGPIENVRFLLDEFGWDGVFDSLVHRARFARGKPAPDCFLRAAEDLEQRPRRLLVFEDSVHGLGAARRGAFQAAAIATTHREAELRPLARWVLRDFRDIYCD